MNIFITGASGFIGGAIARKLRGKHTIFAMARSPSSISKVKSLGVVPVHCDLNNIGPEHLKDCEVVIHCAAYAEEWGTEKDFYDANVLGTSYLIDAAKKAGVKRFIYIGTEAACFYGQDMFNVNETIPYAFHSPYPYSRTKAEAEKRVLSSNAPGFCTLSIRPRLVWGPNDQSILPAVLDMINKGRFAWIGGGDFLTSTTHVENLAHAIELALVGGKCGEAYFVCDDENVNLRKFLSAYIETQGVEIPKKTVPTFLARLAARSIEFIWHLLSINKKPPMVRFSIDIMSANCTLDCAKARAGLGYRPVISREEGLNKMSRLQNL